MMTDALIVARDVVKGYRTTAGYVPVLEGLDLEVGRGEMLAITGASGVGKSTLLHVLGTLDRPESGTVTVDGEDVFTLPETRLRQFRNRTLGFVFQFHHLLPEFSALENVMLPQMLAGQSRRAAGIRARELLGSLGLAERETHRPARLSGGEQQRVAIARAMANRPAVLLADEPTGNLDETTADRVFDALVEAIQETGAAALIATHNADLAARTDVVLRLHGGLIEPA
jgi:lipoprotein-releasing system ATP-binding protein